MPMRRWLTVPTALLVLGFAVHVWAQEVQLLANPGFEDGLDGWSLWPGESGSTMNHDTEVVSAGAGSLRIDAVSPTDRAFVNTSTAGFETEVIYRISVAIRTTPGVPDSAVGFLINYRGGEGGGILSRAYPMGLEKTPEGEWTRWSGLFYCTPEITQWQFLLRLEYAVGSVWFDDIRFERLGLASEITPDIWTYLPVGVEIGSGPARRFSRHMEERDEAYQTAGEYNNVLMESALVEGHLRELERCFAYAGREPPGGLRDEFSALDQRLNQAYQAFAAAFRADNADVWAACREDLEFLYADVFDLGDEVRRAWDSIRPDDAAEMPEHLGEQSREVPPFNRDMRMNRLLIGAWSPTSWREFEEVFDFEFHSGWHSGQPEEWPEGGEPDFSNITELCDELEEYGYAGTFAMMPFGQHDVIWAPEWFMERHADDPDIRKVSWDGHQGRDHSGYYGLNFYHPAVRQHIHDYLKAFATFAADEPRVLFYETAQEAYPHFGCEPGRRQTGYGASALKRFHLWLHDEYGDIAKLNRAWGTGYRGFTAIEPPPDRFAEPDREITPLVAEFERFIEKSYMDYLQLIYESIKAGDGGKPVASRHSGLLTSINGARAFDTCDILGYHSRAPRMQVMNLYLNSLSRYNDNRPLAYLEDFWGTQQESDRVTDELVQRRGLEKHVCRTFAWGRTLQMKWYAYTSGSYLTTYNGNWFNPRYDVLTMRYCAPALKIALDRVRNLDWVLTHSTIPQFRVCIWQPSASMRTQARNGLAVGEIMALHHVLFPGGFPYELVPEEYFEDGRASLDDFDVVFLPCAEYLAEDHQRRLIDFVRAGGTLIAGEPPGVRDELTRPSGLLLREVYGIGEVGFDAETAQWSLGSLLPRPLERLGKTEVSGATVGEGEAYLSPVTLSRALGGEAGNRALLELLAERVERDAWAEQARFECLLRVTEDGERYLFVLNPSADEARSDLVRLGFAARAATDVSVPGGFPVEVRQAGDGPAIQMALGAGEMAVLWLR